MVKVGIEVVKKEDVYVLSGALDEYSDFGPLLSAAAPLKLNMKNVVRYNSIGIRNLLKFLADWGSKAFEYYECSSEFIDQVNMIPALCGIQGQGQVISLYVPYECDECGHEEEILYKATDLKKGAPPRTCSKCKKEMVVFNDSFFVFLTR